MTKLQKAERLSAIQTKQKKQLVRTEAETQKVLQQTLLNVNQQIAQIATQSNQARQRLTKQYNKLNKNLDRNRKLQLQLTQKHEQAYLRGTLWTITSAFVLGIVAGVLLTSFSPIKEAL